MNLRIEGLCCLVNSDSDATLRQRGAQDLLQSLGHRFHPGGNGKTWINAFYAHQNAKNSIFKNIINFFFFHFKSLQFFCSKLFHKLFIGFEVRRMSVSDVTLHREFNCSPNQDTNRTGTGYLYFQATLMLQLTSQTEAQKTVDATSQR